MDSLTASNGDLPLAVDLDQAMVLQIGKQLLDYLHFRSGLSQLGIVTAQGSLILLLTSLVLSNLGLQLGNELGLVRG